MIGLERGSLLRTMIGLYLVRRTVHAEALFLTDDWLFCMCITRGKPNISVEYESSLRLFSKFLD